MKEKTDDLNLRKTITITPVGIVKSEIKEPSLTVRSGNLELTQNYEIVRKEIEKIRNLVSEIKIDDRFKGILDGIEEFSHIIVLYWPHKLPREKRNLIKVHPIGLKELPLTGVFATCSPARPNPVLVTIVKLIERDKNVLKVQGLEAIDNTPVIDIKPYTPHYCDANNIRLPVWMTEVMKHVEKNETKTA